MKCYLIFTLNSYDPFFPYYWLFGLKLAKLWAKLTD